MAPASGSNPFDSDDILAGIRRWVEVETPTERPDQINRLASMVVEEYAGLPVTIDRIAGRDGYGDHLVVKSPGDRTSPASWC
jgi:glutamate carboxypeptidase